MARNSGRPTGAPWLSPYLTVRDVATALEFYERAFGFTKTNAVEGPDGIIRHAEMAWNDAMILLGAEGAYGSTVKPPASSGVPSPVLLYVYCDDVDALFARATEAGATVGFPPADMFWGDRACKLSDPDGHAWTFATHIATAADPAQETCEFTSPETNAG